MKKLVSEEEIRGVKGFKIDKEISSKMSDKIYQHRTQDSELSQEDYVIKGNVDDQAEGLLNFEQPTMVQINSGYDSRIPSHMTGENHDKMVGKVGTANSLNNIPLVKSDIAGGGNMNVPLRSWPMRNHHDILMYSSEYSHETKLSSYDGDKYAPNIRSNILTKSQVHKESDDRVHEDVEFVTSVANGGGIDNHDHALEDVQTHSE